MVPPLFTPQCDDFVCDAQYSSRPSRSGRRKMLSAILILSPCESRLASDAAARRRLIIDIADHLTVALSNDDAGTGVAQPLTVVLSNDDARTSSSSVHGGARSQSVRWVPKRKPRWRRAGLRRGRRGVSGGKVPACSIDTILAAELQEQNANIRRRDIPTGR